MYLSVKVEYEPIWTNDMMQSIFSDKITSYLRRYYNNYHQKNVMILGQFNSKALDPTIITVTVISKLKWIGHHSFVSQTVWYAARGQFFDGHYNRS